MAKRCFSFPTPAWGYGPIAAVGPQPTLIYFHGGGFVAGGVETHDGLCRQLVADGGFKVIAVDYRLAPEHPYPAAVEDAWAASQWIEQNGAQLGVDGGRLAQRVGRGVTVAHSSLKEMLS